MSSDGLEKWQIGRTFRSLNSSFQLATQFITYCHPSTTTHSPDHAVLSPSTMSCNPKTVRILTEVDGTGGSFSISHDHCDWDSCKMYGDRSDSGFSEQGDD